PPFPAGSARWGMSPFLLKTCASLIRRQLEMGREDEHHVQKVGELAQNSVAALPTERRRRFGGFLDELRGDRVRSTLGQLRRVGARRKVATAPTKESRELRQETPEVRR